MADIPKWSIKGDWFDVCSCDIACPCEFAQPPTGNHCEGVLVFHITSGQYGDVPLDGLNVLNLGTFDGNPWAGEIENATLGVFIDERADENQREAILAIFGGRAGGFAAMLASLFGEPKWVEFAPISFDIAGDLAYWEARIPGKVAARAEALTGPTTPPGKRVQLLNPPGSETGPGQIATWGKTVDNEVDADGFTWNWAGKSSKHIPFDWSGPD